MTYSLNNDKTNTLYYCYCYGPSFVPYACGGACFKRDDISPVDDLSRADVALDALGILRIELGTGGVFSPPLL